MFLGSRLGNSLLLRFASREAEVGQARRGERKQPSKRLDMQGDWPVTEPEMDADFWEAGDSCSKNCSFYF